jgi:myo-inositol 2-dehydrogenase / D-chiro-inositol 1-dehydrogenase
MEPKQTDETGPFNRRDFLGAAALGGALFAAACGAREEAVGPLGPKMEIGPLQAPDGPVLRAGLIGCGGRGTGAAGDFLSAGPSLEVVALADIFQDRVDRCRERLQEQHGVEIPDEHCFTGFDCHRELLDNVDVDIILQATPPHFRPAHFEAAVQARKHVFMEKPVAVDPVGSRSVMATAERADAFGLTVVAGTQFRHQRSFIETYNRVQDGAIGRIVAARAYSLRGQLWYRVPQPEWSEMEAMLRDWVNWNWLSGDFIVEQHIHGLDVLFWFTGRYPVRGIALGGRARRVTGDQYDFFAVDYELEGGVHMHTLSRQVDGCTNNISRWVVGTRGYTNCEDTIFDLDGNVIWKYEEGEPKDNSPYVQEHIDMVTAIRTGQRVNEADFNARSAMGAIMARDSAYTGLEITWEELMASDQRLGPTEYAWGPVGIEAKPPVPGIQRERT